MKKALLVIDMVKDFLEKDGTLYCGDRAREIIPFVQKKIEEMRNQKAKIIFVTDTHEEDDLEFQIFPKHCVEGTRGAEIIDELEIKQGDYIVKKKRYSGFYDTNLEKILNKEEIAAVYVVGVCTSICVMDTISDLRNRDYPTFVFEKGVEDFDTKAHTFALERIKAVLGAHVI
ncbi:MAG: isochorismatase family cysteine hydrolase [Thermodesulfobacteriota bacterium]|nr:isochorismatase family cysteine hydrolase [Thermodesulfobacteriota bacterium]